MAVYIIVSASTRDWPMTSEWENLVAIAEAMGTDPETLGRTSVPLIGEWNGEREHSRAIRLDRPRDVQGWRDVHATAYRLREALGQEAVMVLAEHTYLGERYMGEVFGDVERVSIALPGWSEAMRENLGTSTQTDGTPIINGVRNGSRWTTIPNDYGTHVQAFV